MNNKNVKKFNELMNPELGLKLGIHNHLVNSDDQDYFFTFKQINRIYDEDIIKVLIYDVRSEGDELIFRTKITIQKNSFDIYIIVDFDNNVEFGTSKGKNYMEKFERVMKPEFEYFTDMFENIYKDIIPHDYWEVKSKMN